MNPIHSGEAAAADVTSDRTDMIIGEAKEGRTEANRARDPNVLNSEH